MKQYLTKTGIQLSVIQGGGQGDGVPCGLLRSVDLRDTLQGETVAERVAEVKRNRPMTKGELHEISKRITEIEDVIAICDPKRDVDVIDNLQLELRDLDAQLKAGVSRAK